MRLARFTEHNPEVTTPEEIAESLRVYTGVNASPIDLNKVISYWPGLRISIADISNSGYLLELGPDRGEIVVRRRDWPWVRRFTVGHEIGHWLLGSGYSHNSLRAVGIIPVEAWCDRFSAALLVPEKHLAEYIGNLSMEDRSPELGYRIAACPEFFNVSSEVAFRRLIELHDVLSVMIFRRGQLVYRKHPSLDRRTVRSLLSYAQSLFREDRELEYEIRDILNLKLLCVRYFSRRFQSYEHLLVGFSK